VESLRQPCDNLRMAKTPKRPRDINQLAKLMTDILGEVEDRERTPEERGVDPAASAMGKKASWRFRKRSNRRLASAALTSNGRPSDVETH
jgi:hypothetical protein